MSLKMSVEMSCKGDLQSDFHNASPVQDSYTVPGLTAVFFAEESNHYLFREPHG
jgi:hypothetical protein